MRITLNNYVVPAAFDDPEEFIPERWTSQPELIHDSRAYAPFSVGEYFF
jgi:tryprostatin B 6-hydroxylase